MSLTPDQLNAVREWIEKGQSLSAVQKLLDTEYGIKMTYMDVRFLVEDLDLTLRDNTSSEQSIPSEDLPTSSTSDNLTLEPDEISQPGSVTVGVDAINRPGSIISGSVTFSDGQTAQWQLDQMGRIGLVPASEGYHPPQKDLAEFQDALENELRKKGF